MKSFVAFACLLAVAKAGNLIAPLAYSHYQYAQPLLATRGFSYSTVTAHSSPLAYAAPVHYQPAPVAYASAPVHYAPAPVHYAASPVHYASAPVVAVAKAAPVAYVAPVSHAVAPIAGIVKSQYHAQDELGQASYGHAEAFQQHNAVQDISGNKAGAYSYVAPDGQVISASYVADALGYRVVSNALPVGPTETVAETPEVAEARAAHLAAHEEIKHRSRRGVFAYSALPVAHSYAYSPIAYSTPLAYTAPIGVTRAATLTTVVNNPGHAVSYRVD